MPRKLAKSKQSNDLSRCQHFSTTGRRCRLPLCNRSPFFCRNHSYLQPPAGVIVDLSHELISGVGKPSSAAKINQLLSKLVVLLAQDRISPRRAAVMAYTCNLLLRTIPAMELEAQPEPDPTPRNFYGDPIVRYVPPPAPKDVANAPQSKNLPQQDSASPDSAEPGSASPAAGDPGTPTSPIENAVPAHAPEQPRPPVLEPAIGSQSAYNSYMRAMDNKDNPPGRRPRGFRHSRGF